MEFLFPLRLEFFCLDLVAVFYFGQLLSWPRKTIACRDSRCIFFYLLKHVSTVYILSCLGSHEYSFVILAVSLQFPHQ